MGWAGILRATNVGAIHEACMNTHGLLSIYPEKAAYAFVQKRFAMLPLHTIKKLDKGIT